MAQVARVALVRSDNRRGAIAQALELVEDDLRAAIKPRVVLKPNLVSHVRQLPSTHPQALSATLDALLAAGAGSVTIAEGATDADAGFDAFGHRAEVSGRPASFFDLNRDEDRWVDLDLLGVDGSTLTARLSATIADAPCRVSLALLKTHVLASATMGIKNMLSSIHPADRVRMHGHAGGNGATGWRRRLVEFLKGDDAIVNAITRIRGRARRASWLVNGRGRLSIDRLSPAQRHFLGSVAVLHRNLATLAARVRPDFAVLDGFVAMHREGPRHGTPIRLGIALAGADPVAVDAIGAAAMGFDPMDIGYLRLAHEAGVGVADLSRIEIVGDPLAEVARHCVPHSNEPVLRHWEHFDPKPSSIPRPHLRVDAAREATAR